jgi:hypothetical protein
LVILSLELLFNISVIAVLMVKPGVAINSGISSSVISLWGFKDERKAVRHCVVECSLNVLNLFVCIFVVLLYNMCEDGSSGETVTMFLYTPRDDTP